MITELIIALCGISLMLSFSALSILLYKFKRLDQRFSLTEQALKQAKNERKNIRKQITELHSGAVGIGNKFIALELQLDQLNSQQQDIVDFDPESKLYSRAVKMVELGADLAEVMAECELPKAEAELLLSLHKQ